MDVLAKRVLWISLFYNVCFSSRRRDRRFDCDWSSDVCSSDLQLETPAEVARPGGRHLNDRQAVAPEVARVRALIREGGARQRAGDAGQGQGGEQFPTVHETLQPFCYSLVSSLAAAR